MKLYFSWDELVSLASWKVEWCLHKHVMWSTCILLKLRIQQPASSHPPVERYVIRHNTTANGSVSEVISHWTNITLHGAPPGHVYFIQVTPVNVLGPGPPTTTGI